MKYLMLPITHIRLFVYALGIFTLFVGAYVWYTKLFNRNSINTDAALQREDVRWILVYIGSPTCGSSNHPALPRLWKITDDTLRFRARRLRLGLHRVGLTLGGSVHAGLKHLERMGAFDEISVGGGWRNLSFRWLRGALGGVAATPQLVLYLEQEGTPRLLLRLVGPVQWQRWAASRMPLALIDTLQVRAF